MVTIVRGDSKLVVSNKTFEEQYKPLGYQIASNDKEATKKVASIVNKEENQVKEKNNSEKEEKKINEKYGFKTKKGK